MTTTSIAPARGLRRTALILLAACVVAAAVLIAGRYLAAPALAATSRSVSCATNDFHPFDSSTTWTIGSARVLYRTSGAGSASFYCSPAIPPAAVVTKLQVTVADYANNAEMGPCQLERMSLEAATAGDTDVMATTAGTGVAAQPGAVRLVDSSIANATIKSGTYAYQIRCTIPVNASAGVIGATVTYST